MPNQARREPLFGLLGGSQKKQQEEELQRYRYYDTFTGLGNSDLLSRHYAQLEQRAGAAFVLIRLNGFNRLNTIFGLDLGGKTIQRLAPILQDFAQGRGGFAYRMVLDRFALLIPGVDPAGFLEELKILFRAMEQVNVEDKHTTYSYHYTFSYGVYYLTGSPEEKLLEVAGYTDSAVQRLASHHSTQGTVFGEETRPDWELHSQLARDLQPAWSNREFVPYYQTVHDLKNKKAVGAELLTRWIHPTKGLIMPGDFLPIMESAGLIMDLDLYMLEEACKKVKGWLGAELLTVPLSINISKLNLHRQDFVERIIQLVRAYDIPPELIELELTESAVIYEKNEALIGLMNRLHGQGFTLTMDNCGDSDVSSVNLLRDLPVDAVKVSARFFQNVDRVERERLFVANILRMAREMGIKIMVSGVETEQEAQLYRQLGCDFAQGYYFSKPISNEAFERLIF